jgi:photosystem II stability/assembly factor-like uncharacterized protein
MRPLFLPLILAACAISSHAQWTLEDSHTTASLRGIHNVGGGVAWASGSKGTVLRSEDGGYLWQTCNMPPGAEKLDFRGIQGFDENTAIVMSSGKGDLSRLYKTTDACQSWKLVFTNPDKDGFFDSLASVTSKQLYLLGDPVNGKFSMFHSSDAGNSWSIADDPGLEADKDAGAFAASNSSFVAKGNQMLFGTGGGSAAHVYFSYAKCPVGVTDRSCPPGWGKSDVPLASGAASAGVFSIAARNLVSMSGKVTLVAVAVGGIYDKPDAAERSAAFTRDGGKTWAPSQTTPAGYRSAVAFDSKSQTWITVGPNGTDVSIDDGKNWRPLKPGKEDGAETDRDWNALSLPFVVGPKGRIGRLNENAITGLSGR